MVITKFAYLKFLSLRGVECTGVEYCYTGDLNTKRKDAMKQLLFEAFGTFFVALTVMVSGGENPLAVGLMIAALMYVGRAISGAHLNPAISLTLYATGRLGLDRLGWYVVSQLVGAFIAALFYFWIFSQAYLPGIIMNVGIETAMIMEALLTMVVCLVVFVNAQEREVFHGATMVGIAFCATLFIGGSLNPAVAGAALLSGAVFRHPSLFLGKELLGHILVYICGPLLGALCAAAAHRYFNKPQEQQTYRA